MDTRVAWQVAALLMLDTFEFEARDFYEAHGYAVQSQTDDFPT